MVLFVLLQKQLKEEVRIYRQHLHEEAEEERQIEKQLDTIISAEVEKQWERRIAQWMREKEARQKLLQDVLNIRKQQVQDKCELEIKNLLLVRVIILCFTIQ